MVENNQPTSSSSPAAPLDDLTLRAAQLELDRQRFQFEKELETKKLRTSLYSNGIILAFIGAFAALLSSSIQGCVNLRLERQKAQASIVLKAIETGNPKDAANNLLFFVRIGLLDDSDHKLETLLRKPDEVPVLPARLGQGGPYFKADLEAYCNGRYGATFHATDGKCSDGIQQWKVEPSEACKFLTGSAEYSIDPASMEIHCDSNNISTEN